MEYRPGDQVRFANKRDGPVYTIEKIRDGKVQLLGVKDCYYELELFEPEGIAMPEDNQVVKRETPPEIIELADKVLDEAVKRPPHYQNSLGIEVIDIINEYFANNYNLGNVLKYLLRADKKGNRQQDLEKALQYLTWEVDRERQD